MAERAHIGALRAADAKRVVAACAAHQLQLENRNLPGLPFNLDASARQFIQLLPANLDGGIHGRHLLDVSRAFLKRGKHILARRGNRVRFQNLARDVLGVRDRAEPDSGDVFFFRGLEKFAPARGAPDENGQHAGCHRVERPAVADALFMEHAPQLRCHILAGPAVGLVHN